MTVHEGVVSYKFLQSNYYYYYFVYFYLFSFFSKIYYRKTVDFTKIQTRIGRIEGEHADHLTTTTAHHQITLFLDRLKCQHLRRREVFHEF